MNAAVTADAFTAPTAEITFDADQEPQRLFSPRGRLGVLKYAAQSMVWTLIIAAIGALVMGAGALIGGESAFAVSMAVAIVAILPAAFVGICLLIKRLHDINMSGWFLLLSFVPLIGSLFFLFVMFKPGKPEVNRFGAQAETKGWEKVLGGIYIAFMIAVTAAAIFGAATGGLGMMM